MSTALATGHGAGVASAFCARGGCLEPAEVRKILASQVLCWIRQACPRRSSWRVDLIHMPTLPVAPRPPPSAQDMAQPRCPDVVTGPGLRPPRRAVDADR